MNQTSKWFRIAPAQIVEQQQTSTFPSLQSFFGPTHNWREVFLEEAFNLQMHLGTSYSEVRKMPIVYRKWFVKRLIKHFNDMNERQNQMSSKNKNSTDRAKISGNDIDNFEASINRKFS